MSGVNSEKSMPSSVAEYLRHGTLFLTAGLVIVSVVYRACLEIPKKIPRKELAVNLLQLILISVVAILALVVGTLEIIGREGLLRIIIDEVMGFAIGMYSLTVPTAIQMKTRVIACHHNIRRFGGESGRFQVAFATVAVFAAGVGGSTILFKKMSNVVVLVRLASWLIVFVMSIVRSVNSYLHLIQVILSQPQRGDEIISNQYRHTSRLSVSYVCLWVTGTCFLVAHWTSANWLHSFIATQSVLVYFISTARYNINCEEYRAHDRSRGDLNINCTDRQDALVNESNLGFAEQNCDTHSTPHSNVNNKQRVSSDISMCVEDVSPITARDNHQGAEAGETDLGFANENCIILKDTHSTPRPKINIRQSVSSVSSICVERKEAITTYGSRRGPSVCTLETGPWCLSSTTHTMDDVMIYSPTECTNTGFNNIIDANESPVSSREAGYVEKPLWVRRNAKSLRVLGCQPNHPHKKGNRHVNYLMDGTNPDSVANCRMHEARTTVRYASSSDEDVVRDSYMMKASRVLGEDEMILKLQNFHPNITHERPSVRAGTSGKDPVMNQNPFSHIPELHQLENMV